MSWMDLGNNEQTAAKQVATGLVPGLQTATSAKFSSVKGHDTTAPAATTDAGNTITSDDFLTLLVTEMKNQDPTQPTDPNEYIQQLVGVNSLQQLISINGELGTATGTTPSGGVQPSSGI